MTEKIDSFPMLRQTTDNGSWIACAVMIWNYLYPQREVSIAEAKKEFDLLVDNNETAVELLGKMYGWDEYEYIDYFPCDLYAIPTFEEIQEEMNQKKPLICCVSNKKPHDSVSAEDVYQRYENLREVASPHWVIIIGTEGRNLTVVDPLDGKEHDVPYDGHYYIKSPISKYYWQSTFYLGIDTSQKTI